MSIDAMKQALEALEKTRDENVAYMDFKEPYHEAITALRTAIEQAKRQQALDKMAEDERRLGIQMQPGPAEWNKSIRDGVDSLLAQAGFEPDSSARHQLAMMNFESTTVQLKNWRVMLPGGRMTDEWESARAGDYNRGWNAYRKAAKAVLEKLEATPPAAPMQETTGQAPCAPAEDGVCEALECCKKPNAAPVQEPVAFNAGVPPLYPEMKDGETISVEYTTPPTEPVQETSGCRHKRYSVDVHEQIGICYDCGAEGRMRFVVGDATPPAAQQQWVGLTDEEIEKMAVENGHATFLNDDEETGIIWFDGDATPFARAIEQKLREKNGGAA